MSAQERVSGVARCYACRRTIPASFFGRDAYKASGRPSICLECDREKSRRYYAENREAKLAAARARAKRPSKPCARCGGVTPSARHTYCEVCAEAARLERGIRKDRRKLAARLRGYGLAHQRERRRVGRLVDAGLAMCVRFGEVEGCPGAIQPGSRWHLDHTDDRSGWLGPSHPRCNSVMAARKSNAVAGGSREW